MKITAKNMKKYREEAHLSPQALAERIVVTQKVVAAWERGDALPDFDTLLLIANALGVDVADLIYDRRISSEEYICSRPKRVKVAVILAVIFLLILASVLFLYCADFGDKRSLALGRLLNVVLIPAVYAFGIAELASIGAIWYDFRVTCKILRIVLLGLGVTLSLIHIWHPGDSFLSFKKRWRRLAALRRSLRISGGEPAACD